MPDDLRGFLERMALDQPSNRDLGVAVLWWHAVHGDEDGLSVADICREIEAAGYPKQNRSRLAKQLTEDGRTRKLGKAKVGVSVRARSALDELWSPLLKSLPRKATDSVIPAELFENTRPYVERVVVQINGSYDAGLYDCTAVMSRRLLETLIIEVYEASGRADDIRGHDGHFLMLSGLITKVENDRVITLGREALRGLKAFKKLGDQSAHNRRFLARRGDIDRVRDGLRIAAEDLLHLAWPDGG